MKTIQVVSGLFTDSHGRIYLQRRPEGKRCPGMWEPPGGKVEANEALDEALLRELKEELIDAFDFCPSRHPWRPERRCSLMAGHEGNMHQREDRGWEEDLSWATPRRLWHPGHFFEVSEHLGDYTVHLDNVYVHSWYIVTTKVELPLDETHCWVRPVYAVQRLPCAPALWAMYSKIERNQ